MAKAETASVLVGVGDNAKQIQKRMKKDSKVARKLVKAFMRFARRGRKMTSNVRNETTASLITKKKLRNDDIVVIRSIIEDVVTARSIAVPRKTRQSVK
jgi:hypothetical protein